MPGRSTKVVLVAVAAALLAVLTAPAALAGAGPSCYQIANDSHGFAPGTGVDLVDVKATTATIVVNYVKSFPCVGPGQLWAELGKGRTDVSYHATPRVGAGAVSNSYQQKRFDIRDLTPNTVYSARGGLGYAFQDYRTDAEVFRTAPDLARNADIFHFAHFGQGAYAWSFEFSPNFIASRFGETFLSIEYGGTVEHGTKGKFDHQSREHRCYPAERFGNRCANGAFTIDAPALRDGEPNQLVTYDARLLVRNTVSGSQRGPTFQFACTPAGRCLTISSPRR
jgi:hypothetical protein